LSRKFFAGRLTPMTPNLALAGAQRQEQAAAAGQGVGAAAGGWAWSEHQTAPASRPSRGSSLGTARHLPQRAAVRQPPPVLPLRTGQGKVGVIGVSRPAKNFLLNPAERRLLAPWATSPPSPSSASAWPRTSTRRACWPKTEKLRSALLTSISHDLRTPLALIIGSLSSLKSYGTLYDDKTREEMLNTSIDEAERLNRYVATCST